MLPLSEPRACKELGRDEVKVSAGELRRIELRRCDIFLHYWI